MRALHRRLLARIALATFSALLFTVAACGGDDGSIVGTWRSVPHGSEAAPPPVDQRDRWTFSEDGAFTAVTASGTDTGTWSVDGDRLTISITSPDTSTTVVPFVLSGDSFLFGAALPNGSVDGFVGMWQLMGTFDGQSLTVDLDIRADNTFTYTAVSPNGTNTLTGTWQETPPGFQLTATTTSGTININLFQLGSAGIGGPLFELI